MKIREWDMGLDKNDLEIEIKDRRFDSEDSQSNSRQAVNKLLFIRRMKMGDLAKRLNELYPDDKFSMQNLSNKLFRGGIRDFELAQIAKACGYSLRLIPNEFDMLDNEVDKAYYSDSQVQQAVKASTETVETNHNGILVIAGVRAAEAAKAYKMNCAEADALKEVGFAKILEKKYNVFTQFVTE